MILLYIITGSYMLLLLIGAVTANFAMVIYSAIATVVAVLLVLCVSDYKYFVTNAKKNKL